MDATGENVWREIEHASKLPARYRHQATFATEDDYLLLFGGDGGRGYLNDTWLFDAEHNTWDSVNTEQAPVPRTNAAMTNDPSNNVTILFGGLGEHMTDLQDTWIFKETDSGGEWTNITSSQ